MANTRDELVDRSGENSPSAAGKPNVVKRALRAAGPNGPPEPSKWLKPIANYDRHERREYQVVRFG